MTERTTATQITELQDKARELRRDIITMTTAAGSGHPTSSLSAVEILTALNFGGVLRYDPKRPAWLERDRFILSKGHAAPVLYAVLAHAGYFSREELPTLRQLGSPLEGHPNMRRLSGVEASTGSLGQGLSIGLGHALAAGIDGLRFRVYVLLGDGENDEGQVWEAAMAAVKYRADNLVAIVDHNKYQQTGPTAEVLDLTPMVEKWQAFGWNSCEINGHDLREVLDAFHQASQVRGRPTAIIAHTQKGRGIASLLHELKDANYHGKALPKDAAWKALDLLKYGER